MDSKRIGYNNRDRNNNKDVVRIGNRCRFYYICAEHNNWEMYNIKYNRVPPNLGYYCNWFID